MPAYVHRVQEGTSRLKNFSIAHILQSKNCQANALSKLASSYVDGKQKGFSGKHSCKEVLSPRRSYGLIEAPLRWTQLGHT